MLVAGMLRPAHLLDIVRNFTLFKQAAGQTIKIVARYQQFRAVQEAIRGSRTGSPDEQHGGSRTSAAASSGTPRGPARA